MDSTPSRPARRTRPFRAVQATIAIAILLATLFTALPSRGLVSRDFYDRLSLALTPRPGENAPLASQPQERIGIVAGHSGNDSGAVCLDGNGNQACANPAYGRVLQYQPPMVARFGASLDFRGSR